MVDPITIGIGITLVFLSGYLWDYIVTAFQKSIIPWFREKLGDDVGDQVAVIFSWIDKSVCATKRQVEAAWQTVNRHLLGSQTQVLKKSSTEAEIRRTDYMVTPDGQVKRRVTEETVSWQDLPDNLRKEMIRQNTDQAKMDNKEALRQQMVATAKEENMVLELEMGVS